MPAYDFERLSPSLFERLIVALAHGVIGPGLVPFGKGRDGGREATFEGRMDYPSEGAAWDGYLVVQCKQKEERGPSKKAEADWAIDQLRREMEAYETAEVARRRPDYFLFVTNAELSPAPRSGGKDRFRAKLDEWSDRLGIRAADVWDRDKIAALLDTDQAVARRFGFLHQGDVLHAVASRALADLDDAEATLTVYLQEEMLADQYVRLSQAGHLDDERTPLSKVFVDLPAKAAALLPRHGRPSSLVSASPYVEVVASLQSAGDAPLRPSVVPETPSPVVRSEAVDWDGTSRFVVVGGPGQGKSTLTQHVAQRHRAAVLDRRPAHTLTTQARTALRAVKREANESEDGLPAVPRFPFRVVLDRLAAYLADGGESVSGYLAASVSERTDRPFTAASVEAVVRESPTLLVLDGLDEVPATSNRAQVLGAVRRFLTYAQTQDADLLVIATTRPQGYEDEFGPESFSHLQLLTLPADRAIAYGERFAAVRYEADVERRDLVIERLRDAAAEPATARLMTTPLQVTIMAALVSLVGHPPRERFSLFSRYYDIVLQREQEREIGTSRVLMEHKNDIDALHDRIGLLLQIATEADPSGRRGGTGRLSGEDLRQLIVERLEDEEYDADAIGPLAQQILDVALLRLVFVVPLEEDQYGFEVRSLQEFAAARALMRGGYEEVKRRLLAVAPAPYWRNVVLFAVGQASALREDLRDLTVRVCDELDDEGSGGHVRALLPGARLALDVVEAGAADVSPKYRRDFLRRALTLLALPDAEAAGRLAAVYGAGDQSLYERAVSGAPDPLAACSMLSGLENTGAAWVGAALDAHWPDGRRDDQEWWEHEAVVYEALAPTMRWTPHRVARAEDFARRVYCGWVRDNLSDHVPSDWVPVVRDIVPKSNDRARARLALVHEAYADPTEEPRAEGLEYLLDIESPDPDVIESIAGQDLNPRWWSPILAAAPWLRERSAESLAESLERLAETTLGPETWVSPTLGWPFVTAASGATRDDLLDRARRVRGGEFGGPPEWEAAQARWIAEGVSPGDWISLDDARWPFPSEMTVSGIVPHLEPRPIGEDLDSAVTLLVEAFAECSSERARTQIAYAIAGVLRHNGLDDLRVHVLSLATLDAVVLANDQDPGAEAGVMAYLTDTHDICEASVDTLDRMGRGCHLAVEHDPTFSPEGIDERVERLVGLIGPHRDGIVRLVAGLVLAGARAPSREVLGVPLGPAGRVAVAAIDLFRTGSDAYEVFRQLESVADHRVPHSTVREVRRVLAMLLSRTALSFPVTASPDTFLALVAGSTAFGARVRIHATETLSKRTQYVTSGLEESDARVSLGL